MSPEVSAHQAIRLSGRRRFQPRIGMNQSRILLKELPVAMRLQSRPTHVPPCPSGSPTATTGTMTPSVPLPSSSYRLGVRRADLHTLYPPALDGALRRALAQFDSRLPGFAGPSALLHGVETRTSAPVSRPALEEHWRR
uniref:FAD-dependent protein C-terminal domain-containing protein n=1 Tax=Chlamydomonas euryale TaxID=1486919 RepID=A0A7R9YVT7_9CHLO|mmetsp:Transcript_28818/g.85289  ORF Transcript_28818/g.85289 Transcript_28818/m.85289 type:complete len:139 (+) Transcript_28818:812-1228(+)